MTWEEPVKGTYTGRYIDTIQVKEITDNRILTTEGSSFPVPKNMLGHMYIGGFYFLELHRGSTVAGVGHGVKKEEIVWLFRYDDHALWSKWKKEVDDAKSKHRAEVDENYSDWIERIDKLPETLRIELTKELANEEFVYGFMGLGYCLVIAELAVLYKASDGVDSDEVNAFASKHGTSGNQHHMAIAIAKQKL